MAGPKPPAVNLSEAERQGSKSWSSAQHAAADCLAGTHHLDGRQGLNNEQVGRQLHVGVDMVRYWRQRWLAGQAIPLSELSVEERLHDLPEQASLRRSAPISGARWPHWRARNRSNRSGRSAMDGPRDCRRVDEARHRRPDFAPPCGPAAKGGDLKPHLIRSWLTPEPAPQFAAKVADINTLYRQAPTLARKANGRSAPDELTSVQALERKHSGLPMGPGQVERREFEYLRHGTLAFMFNFDIATGQVETPSCGPTRTEVDFANHVRRHS